MYKPILDTNLVYFRRCYGSDSEHRKVCGYFCVKLNLYTVFS